MSFERAEQRGDPAPFFFLFINDVKEIVVSPPPYWAASNGSAIQASGSNKEEKWPTPNWLAERREAYRIGKLRALLCMSSRLVLTMLKDPGHRSFTAASVGSSGTRITSPSFARECSTTPSRLY